MATLEILIKSMTDHLSSAFCVWLCGGVWLQRFGAFVGLSCITHRRGEPILRMFICCGVLVALCYGTVACEAVSLPEGVIEVAQDGAGTSGPKQEMVWEPVREAGNEVVRPDVLVPEPLAEAGEGERSLEPEPFEPPVDAGPTTIPLIKTCTLPATPASGSYEHKKDINYMGNTNPEQTLDVAWPKKPGSYPLVLIVHGGGWVSGDKSSFVNGMLWLTASGYAAATLNYRLVKDGKNQFPAAIQDLRCALRHLRANASRYQIDPTRVVVTGNSAGGHLAALLGVSSDVKGLDHPDCPHTTGSVSVSGVVSNAGAYDLLNAKRNGVPDPRITNFLGASSEENPTQAKLASPIFHLDPTDPPILFHHGTNDTVVPHTQAQSFDAALKKVGIRHLYNEVQGGEHAGFFAKQAPYLTGTCTTFAFLKEVLKP